MIDKILHLIEQSGVLMLMQRSHQKNLGTTFDTVASHTHHASIIAYCLSRMEGLSHEEGIKALATTTFSTLSKARIGDADYIAKQYGSIPKNQAVADQFNGIDFGEDLTQLLSEVESKDSKIGMCVLDANSLEQMYQEWVLMFQGNRLAQRWFESDFNDRVPNMGTGSAKKLANAMKEGTPQDWWWSQFMKDEAVTDINKLITKN